MEERSIPATSRSALILGLCLALGGIIAAAIIGYSLHQVRSSEQFVTVRGLSEREIPADLAFWPMAFMVTGNQLPELQQELERDSSEIESFLSELGFPAEDISRSAPEVNDRVAQGMRLEPGQDRYTLQAVVVLRSQDIDGVKRAIQRSGELVRRGVTLVRNYEYTTQYLFTGLDAVKPDMIAEATRDARRAAEQFASDSGSSVGAIRRAQQGYFSIQDRDSFTPEIKTVRVVTTVDFFLED